MEMSRSCITADDNHLSFHLVLSYKINKEIK